MRNYSVIIPSYNSFFTIRRCLDSIVSQDGNYEIILLNDGSNDSSYDILCEFQRKYHNIRIYNLNHVGVSAARNYGIKRSDGDTILFVDSDDYVSKDLFSVIDREMDSSFDLLRFRVEYLGNRVVSDIFNDITFNEKRGKDALFDYIQGGKIFATPWMYAYDKSLFTNHDFLFCENHIHEDFGLIPLIIYESEKMKSIDNVLYHYVYTNGSLSTNQEYNSVKKRAFDLLAQCDFLSNYSEAHFTEEEKLLFYDYLSSSLDRKKKKLLNSDLDLYKKELVKRKYYH